MDAWPSGRHLKSALFQSLAIDPIAIPFPLQQLDMGSPAIDKNKDITGLKGQTHFIGDNAAKPVEALSGICPALVQQVPVATIKTQHPLSH